LKGGIADFLKILFFFILTKLTDEVCCGEKRSNEQLILNNLQVELSASVLSQRNFGEVFGQRFLHKVMFRIFARGLQTSCLHSTQTWGQITSQGFVKTPSITKYGQKL
jgi:hypothetical protein